MIGSPRIIYSGSTPRLPQSRARFSPGRYGIAPWLLSESSLCAQNHRLLLSDIFAFITRRLLARQLLSIELNMSSDLAQKLQPHAKEIALALGVILLALVLLAGKKKEKPVLDPVEFRPFKLIKKTQLSKNTYR